MNRWYSYIARNYSDLGVSDNSTSVKYHEFPSINEDLLFVIPRDETSIDINWFYDLSEIFAKPYDTVSWKIIRSISSSPRNSVSPGSPISTLPNICRITVSICLSLIRSPCER